MAYISILQDDELGWDDGSGDFDSDPALGQGGQGPCLWPPIYVGPKKKNIYI
jgi:hypothetical protein